MVSYSISYEILASIVAFTIFESQKLIYELLNLHPFLKEVFCLEIPQKLCDNISMKTTEKFQRVMKSESKISLQKHFCIDTP